MITFIILGSELRNWLMFYSLPVLKDILPNPYLTHYALLVTGVVLLSSESITTEDIATARSALNTFYDKFPDLYGKQLKLDHPSGIIIIIVT